MNREQVLQKMFALSKIILPGMAKTLPWKLLLRQIAKHHLLEILSQKALAPESMFRLLLALVAFWGVIYITDFRLLFPKKIGPIQLSDLYCLLHFWYNLHLLIFCKLRIQKIGIGCKHQNSWDLHIFIMPQNPKLLGFCFILLCLLDHRLSLLSWTE